MGQRQSSGDEKQHDAPRLSRRRLLVRLTAMVVALAAIDAAADGYLRDGQRYEADWRLPRTLPTAALPGYVDHIESLRHDRERPLVLFLGASPTWGEMNSDSRHAYPAAFARVAAADGLKARVYNLGTAGALVSDQYFIAARLAGDADLLAVQLTYHTFSPAGRNRGTQRFPELPEILDEAVSPEVASVLDIDPTRFFNLGGAVDSALGRRWVLFREHEEVAARLFDRPARDELHSRWQDLTRSTPARPPLAPSLAPNTRFDELDPARQTEIAGRYADLADYEIERDDPELRMLDLLCARLEHRKTSAVFFISPLNTKALEDFGVFDRRRYEANVSMIRSVVEKHGLVFIDWNQPELALPTGLFADITHTTDAGSALFAQRLYGSLKPQLDGRGARE